jgi:DNA polymerase-1
MKKLLIIDISNIIYRSFYGIKNLQSLDKFPTNAIFGTVNMLLTTIEHIQATDIAIAKDSPQKKIREEIYSHYKANRKSAPEELKKQIPVIFEICSLMNLPILESNEYEADDIIGSLSEQEVNNFYQIIINSGDKDLMQLVNSKVRIYDSMKNKFYNEIEVLAKFGVYPHQIPDYLAIVGDTSDNIPGIKGIGEKGATKLIQEFGSLENIIENVEQIKGKTKDLIIAHTDIARVSKELATIKTNIQYDKSDFKLNLKCPDSLVKILENLSCYSLINKINKFI